MDWRRLSVYAGPVLVWAALIFFLSAQSDLPPSPPIPQADKLGHLALYGVFGLFIARAFIGYGVGPGTSVLLALAVGALYGATDEFHQSFVPKRTADVADWIADAIGTGSGGMAWAFFLLSGRHRARP